ncbi:MAG: bifunctional 5,10-methylenetetrahydrofolate dehydrogenase/5,10-methenyltetrahydrofolate cyclohydrolase [Thermoplasmata archaeon]|nr:bifunctional 5,10-methylenetetrahydrofolate dehydrogenase/5,10-methenyltetrahydrofolate cyclohydrolase [Thermoplasmata archaeon]
MTERLLGAPVAEMLNRSSRAVLEKIPTGAAPPCLASVHRGSEGPFRRYLDGQRKAAESLGLGFREEVLDREGGPSDLLDRIRKLDRDPSVHGVLVEHPLPPPYDFFAALGLLRPEKDVDGVGSENLGRLLTGRRGHAPAVCLASLAIARHYQLPYQGTPVAVIGRSGTVGLPLALLLAHRPPGPNATVTVAHSRTENLARALSTARTIFSCAGRPNLLTRAVVPEGAAVVDIGLGSVPDPSRPGGSRMVGDADPVSLEGWASALTPVPGGVGPVTVAQLMWNTVSAWQMQPGSGATP